MKKSIRFLVFFLVSLFVINFINAENCFAKKKKKKNKKNSEYRDILTDNEDLKESNDDYERALKWIIRGDKTHTAQRAVKNYAKAEEYLGHALFTLEQKGQELSLDVSKDSNYLKNLQRDIHVRQGQARKDSSKVSKGRNRVRKERRYKEEDEDDKK